MTKKEKIPIEKEVERCKETKTNQTFFDKILKSLSKKPTEKKDCAGVLKNKCKN